MSRTRKLTLLFSYLLDGLADGVLEDSDHGKSAIDPLGIPAQASLRVPGQRPLRTSASYSDSATVLLHPCQPPQKPKP